MKNLQPNMGKLDRSLRLIVAVVIAIMYGMDKIAPPTSNILLLLAVVFAATAFLRFCPLYVPFKMDTREEKGDK